MKKLLQTAATIFLVGVYIFGTVSCGRGGEKVKYEPELPAAQVDDYTLYLEDTFNSTSDLSDCQGYRNWYYYCGDPEDGSLAYMVFNDYYGRWCSKYQQLYYFTYMWGTAWLPEDQQGYGIGMGFKAPATGTVSIDVTIRLLALPEFSNGDGVTFTISDKHGDPYEGKSIAAEEGDRDFILKTEVRVAMGEEILFMLFPNSNNTHDFTNVDITIKYIQE